MLFGRFFAAVSGKSVPPELKAPPLSIIKRCDIRSLRRTGGRIIIMAGYRRQVVLLRGTESQFFDEAYFIVKEKAKEAASEKDILEEADRIVRDCYRDLEKRSKPRRFLRAFVSALIGAAVGAGISVMILVL